MNVEPEEIIKAIKDFKTRIHHMDDRVKKYLSDRKRYPHPGHENLIHQVHQFENKVHRIKNSDVQFWLDGLMHTLMVYQRIWQRSFDNGGGGYSGKASPQKSWSDDIPIDKLYQAAQQKWDQLGVDKRMTKEEMLQRVKPQYEKAVRGLKAGERIAWSMNKKNNELHVQVKKDT
ncbi:MAG: hypothetical protein KJ737_09930 [Proteobacteria bacterium]|nr:hypothetical protein [Pseudomonadota bacterium]